ncbi:hypothetical protein FAES_3704 [Fibrella aestuarina BUZ 2]|uniref:Schlafen AlbA-2 domain-containing protein n=1 Tax=Fibrella aestuarina BUZ 2 TaxID=1166018 RepID=I0KC58_9BACT|nr:ATP-binding protein [Fibrella aestuarina]CCH01711.1 hypothetical protein FAES_3704 [Fibrella aestuarina BUZ 2]
MSISIDHIIRYESESSRFEFKKEEYFLGRDGKKHELIKDISAFANHLSDDDKFIIVGVKNTLGNYNEVFGIQNPTDDAQYQQLIIDNIEPKVNFEYRTIKHKDYTICYFRIFDNTNRPYLIKKDIIGPNGNKIISYGDGFVRVGTSTKKMGRTELDDSYNSIINYIDRRNDIIISPIIKEANLDLPKALSKFKEKLSLKHLDISITNNSHKSINLNPEIRIKKKDDLSIISSYKYHRMLYEEKIESKSQYSLFQSPSLQIPPMPDMFVNFEENESEFIFQRNRMSHQTSAIRIDQKDSQTSVFGDSIIAFSGKGYNTILCEVIIRSDEFVKGPLIQEVCFSTTQ